MPVPKTFQVYLSLVIGPSQRTDLDPGRNADNSESSLEADTNTAYLSNLCRFPGPPGLARDPGYPAAATAGPDAGAAAATVTARPPPESGEFVTPAVTVARATQADPAAGQRDDSDPGRNASLSLPSCGLPQRLSFQICARGLGHRDRGHDWHRTPASRRRGPPGCGSDGRYSQCRSPSGPGHLHCD